jgi:hypothetical protein
MLYIVQLTAEGANRHFNVFVADTERDRAEATAEQALRLEGWSEVATLRSGVVSEQALAERDQMFRDAAAAARDTGWAIIRYSQDS